MLVTIDGVPVMVPVNESRVSPLGSAGEAAYDSTTPPLEETVFGVISVPTE
jgi:hypothetical protein